MIDEYKPIVEELNSFIEAHNIEGTTTNSYLFLMFFLQRCQLVSNIIKLISNNDGNYLSDAIKYNLINSTQFSNIKKNIDEFKKHYSKNDILSEILNFIKGTISVKEPISFSELLDEETGKGKSKYAQSIKIANMVTSFRTIKEMLRKIEESTLVNDEDIANYIISDTVDDKKYTSTKNEAKIDKELKNIEKDWRIFLKNKKHENYPLYIFVKKWIKL